MNVETSSAGGRLRARLRLRRRAAGLACAGILASLSGAAPAGAAVLTVNSTADAATAETCEPAPGDCTLREALVAANATVELDRIVFSIPGSAPHSISTVAKLPAITRPVTIDGTSEPDFDPATRVPVVELIRADSNPFEVLDIRADGEVEILGMAVRGAALGPAVQLTAGGATVTLRGNHLGTDRAGTAPGGDDWGVRSFDAFAGRLVVGGPAAADRNVIYGSAAAIRLEGGVATEVQGNFVGLDRTGTGRIGPMSSAAIDIPAATARNVVIGGTATGAGNVVVDEISLQHAHGVRIEGNVIGLTASGRDPAGATGIAGVSVVRSTDNTIGGSDPGAGNVIAGTRRGVWLYESTGTVIQGNRIGTDAIGNEVIGTAEAGILISSNSSGTSVGGTAPGAGNVIAHAGSQAGVGVDGTSTRNRIAGNEIRANAGLGIDLHAAGFGVTPNDGADVDAGPNEGQNFPLLTTARNEPSETLVSGSLSSEPNQVYRVELFATRACDASGHGEGETFLTAASVQTDSAGNVPFAVSLPPRELGSFITATATDPDGNTSEFSECREVVSGDLFRADLELALQRTPPQPRAGELMTYTFTARNLGPATATGVGLDAQLPDGADVLSVEAKSGSCVQAGRALTCSLGSLINGAAATVTAVVRPTGAGVATASGIVRSDQEDPVTPNNEASDAAEVAPPLTADLAVTLARSPAEAVAGRLLTYTAGVRNDGPGAATNARLVVELPADSEVVAVDDRCRSGGGGMTCELGTLGNQATANVTATVRPSGAGEAVATVRALADQADPNAANSVATERVSVAAPPPADLAVALSRQPPRVLAGADATYTATVRNAGPGTASGVRLRVVLPEFATFRSATSLAGHCERSGDVVSCPLGGLAPEGVTRATLVVRPLAGGPVSVSAEVTADAIDALPVDNVATDRVVVELPPPELGETVNVDPARGEVRVRRPGEAAFRPLARPEQLEVGSQIDATDGRVTVETAIGRRGRVQRAAFFDGRFRVGQRRTGDTTATISLAGARTSRCRARRRSVPCRKVWGSGKGRFRTRGNYGSASVRGTEWVTEDHRSATVVRVVRGAVEVRDFVRGRRVTVRAGETYAARKRR